MNDELIKYIKESKENGFSDDAIKKALLDAGWKEEDVKEGLNLFSEVKGVRTNNKTNNKKKIILILIIVGILIAGATVVALNFNMVKNWFTKQPIEELNCEDKCGDGICQEVVCQAIGCPCAETKENCTKDCAEHQVEKQVKNCGSIINTHVFFDTSKLTTQEMDSLQCINEAFMECNYAKIELIKGDSSQGVVTPGIDNMINNTVGIYEIKGKENQKCLISKQFDNPCSIKIYEFSMEEIITGKVEADEDNESYLYFVRVVPLILNDPSNPQIKEIECK